MMADNKHYKAEKVGAFWKFVEKFPLPDYVGKHRVFDSVHGSDQVWMGCSTCVMFLKTPSSDRSHI